MATKTKHIRISRPGMGSYLSDSLAEALIEIEEAWDADSFGDPVTFEIVELTKAEYDELPEFTGW